MESFWAAVTHFGDPRLWTAAILILIFFYLGVQKGRIRINVQRTHMHLLKKFLLLIIPVILVSFVGSEMLKLVFQIPRPCIPCPGAGCNLYCPVTFSFPSGHTTVMTGIATALFLILRKWKFLIIYAAPALIAASRVALGVHTVSDVIAGFFVGVVLTLLVWRYRKKMYKWEDEIL
jgi:membrane-associated phospholipid phosphatase